MLYDCNFTSTGKYAMLLQLMKSVAAMCGGDVLHNY